MGVAVSASWIRLLRWALRGAREGLADVVDESLGAVFERQVFENVVARGERGAG